MWPNCYTFYLGSDQSPLETLSLLWRLFRRSLGGGDAVTDGDKRDGQANSVGSSAGPHARGIGEWFSHRKPFKRKTGGVVPENMECLLPSKGHLKCGLQPS